MTLNLSVPVTIQDLKPRIVVVGVGGAGGNAVENMIQSQLEGIEDLVQEVLRLPVRTGRPAPWSGRREEDPCCSTVAGTVALVLGDDGGLGWRDQVQVSMLSNRLARLGQWFRENF